MRILLLFIILPVSFTLQAQQSLFNVPSITITPHNKFFVQQQINYTGLGVAFNTNTALGLGKGFECGLNITDANFNWKRDSLSNWQHFRTTPSYTLLMLTGTKAFQISNSIKLGIGLQIGVNPLLMHNNSINNLATFNWLNSSYTLKNNVSLFAGIYYGNTTFLISKGQPGLMLGFDWPVVKDRIDVMADCILGKHEEAVSVLGIVYEATKHVFLSFGAQLPSLGTTNPLGGVFELTIN